MECRTCKLSASRFNGSILRMIDGPDGPYCSKFCALVNGHDINSRIEIPADTSPPERLSQVRRGDGEHIDLATVYSDLIGHSMGSYEATFDAREPALIGIAIDDSGRRLMRIRLHDGTWFVFGQARHGFTADFAQFVYWRIRANTRVEAIMIMEWIAAHSPKCVHLDREQRRRIGGDTQS